MQQQKPLFLSNGSKSADPARRPSSSGWIADHLQPPSHPPALHPPSSWPSFRSPSRLRSSSAVVATPSRGSRASTSGSSPPVRVQDAIHQDLPIAELKIVPPIAAPITTLLSRRASSSIRVAHCQTVARLLRLTPICPSRKPPGICPDLQLVFSASCPSACCGSRQRGILKPPGRRRTSLDFTVAARRAPIRPPPSSRSPCWSSAAICSRRRGSPSRVPLPSARGCTSSSAAASPFRGSCAHQPPRVHPRVAAAPRPSRSCPLRFPPPTTPRRHLPRRVLGPSPPIAACRRPSSRHRSCSSSRLVAARRAAVAAFISRGSSSS
uniref:Uncharacterized protein n=1 Tax=Arundo donax TaxID=35708 RepID=A0A0A8ZF08_ARUDO